MKKTAKKLVLAKETVRPLTGEVEKAVVGGSWDCPSGFYDPCQEEYSRPCP